MSGFIRFTLSALVLVWMVGFSGCEETPKKEKPALTRTPPTPVPRQAQPRPPQNEPKASPELEAATNGLIGYLSFSRKPETADTALVLLAEARKNIDKALENEPDDPEVIYTAALIVAKEKDYQKAISLIERGLTIEPKFDKFHLGLGNLYLKTGQRDKANAAYKRSLEIFDEVLEKDPNNPNIVNKRAFSLVLLDRKEEAIAYLEEKVKTSPMPAILQRSIKGYKNEFDLDEYVKGI